MIKTMKPKQIIEFIDKTKHHLTDDNIKHIDKITKKIPNKFSYSFNEKENGRIGYDFDIYVNIENDDI